MPVSEKEQNEQQEDHDLLVRIDERIKNWIIRIDGELFSTNARHAKHDEDIKALRTDVDALIRAKVQIYAVAATSSCVVSMLIKVFWK